MSSSIYIIDKGVSGYQAIVDALPEESLWFLLDPERDGLDQIADITNEFSDIVSLHIVSHGRDGALQLGNALLSTNNLSVYAETLSGIGSHLAATGDILFYGCDVASSPDGLDFIQRLSILTGADVAASSGLSGSHLLGGDWVLEAKEGEVETGILSAPEFSGVLGASDDEATYNFIYDAPNDLLTEHWLYISNEFWTYSSVAGDKDAYYFVTNIGDTYSIFSYDIDPAGNTFFDLYAWDGQLIGQSTDLGPLSGLQFTATYSEYVVIFGSENPGLYPAWVTNDTYAAVDTNGFGQEIVLGSVNSGSIDYVSDSDVFFLAVEAGKTYSLYLDTDVSDLVVKIDYRRDFLDTEYFPVYLENGAGFYEYVAPKSGTVEISLFSYFFQNTGVYAFDTQLVGNSVPSGIPVISGTSVQGQTLTADTSGIADSDGLGEFTYVWKSDGSVIAGATSSTLVLGQAQVGKAITVEVSYTDGFGQAEGPLVSGVTAAVTNLDDEATGTLDVTGTAAEGGTLTASLTSVSDIDGSTTTAYRWQEDLGGTWTDLAGELAATLSLPSDQSFVGKSIRVVATTTDALGGTTEFVGLAQTIANVNDEPTGLPTITGTATQGQTLTADTSGVGDEDGLGALSYVWKADGAVIAGATSSLLVLAQAQVGKAITVEVSYTDAQGTAEGPLASAATGVVASSPVVPVSGTSAADTLRGTGEPDTISRLEGLGGNDSLIGGSRSDVAVYTGNRSDYTIRTVGGVTTITDNRPDRPDGVDTLRGLNVLQFADTMWFQSAAANRTTLGGGVQRYAVANGAFVTGTNAAEHFVVSSSVSASVSSGAGDTVDLAGAISGYTFRASGNQLQVSDGVYTVWLTVSSNPLTLRTASGSTTAAIDFAAGGVIKLGGTQVVGSATFDAAASILNASNLSEQAQGIRAAAAPRVQKTGTLGAESLSGDSQLLTYFEGGGGNDTLVGGSRSDVAVYSGNRSSYTVRTVAGVTTVTDTRANSPDGVDTLRGINVLQFADGYLFQNAAANRTTLGGSAQRYVVSNGEYVIGTNAVERFVVADDVSASIATGAGDVVDLARSIDSYSYRAAGNQLQVGDGLHVIVLTAPGAPLTLRTASGSTTVAIDFAAGGVIKLGGTQVVGSATFDAAAAILDPANVTTAEMLPIRLLDGVPIAARPGVMDIFLLDAGQSINALVTGFEPGDVIRIANLDEEIGVTVEENADFTDGVATLLAGQATLTLSDLPSDLFSDEQTLEAVYGPNAITYVI